MATLHIHSLNSEKEVIFYLYFCKVWKLRSWLENLEVIVKMTKSTLLFAI